ncbi:hypothetical protein E4U57_002652 [Claviceps arundinis]|uniref:Uncharacterized protein n=1 Tax=Claviceps arundinis TaxID=1623583 RepID=A0ABQ7P855_9HYPO|nr:hypothetical protein E4U57_002652 [Claviceps arundinis]
MPKKEYTPQSETYYSWKPFFLKGGSLSDNIKEYWKRVSDEVGSVLGDEVGSVLAQNVGSALA